MATLSQLERPQVLAIPLPMPGHIFPMVQLCKSLSSQGLFVTMIKTLPHYNSWPPLDSPHMHFVSLPDDLIKLDLRITDDNSLRFGFRQLQTFGIALTTFLLQFASQSSAPQFSFVLSDVHLGWTQDLANSLAIPRVALWCSNVSELLVHFHVPRLVAKGCLPFTGRNATSTISDIPGLPPLQRGDFPSLLQREDASDIIFTFFVDQTRRISEAHRVIVNSFYELEGPMFEAVRRDVPEVYPIGPLLLLDGGELDDVGADSIKKESCREEIGWMEWLDRQPTSSVLYVCFGTVVPMTQAEIAEFAMGLENCGHSFLWVLRAGLVQGVEDPLPEGFAERVKGRSRIVKWAPQVKVLRHKAVGGFLTHCGWNSVMESICGGVAMACYPGGADQTLTSKLVVEEWGLGLRVGCKKTAVAEDEGCTIACKAEDVKEAVMQLMGEGGDLFRLNCKALRQHALHSVTSIRGLSHASLSSLVRMKERTHE